MTMDPFGTRLTEALHRTGTPLCMGIDPHGGMIPPLFGNAGPAGSPDAVRAIGDFAMACLDAAKGRVAAIKPQVAFFEAHGPKGMQVLADLQLDAFAYALPLQRGELGAISRSRVDIETPGPF